MGETLYVRLLLLLTLSFTTGALAISLEIICFSYTRPTSYMTYYPACDMAVEDFVNAGWLTDHTIEVLHRNYSCTRPEAMQTIFDTIEHNHITAIVGCLCSSTTKPLSLMLKYWNLAIFPEASTDSSLGDKTYYDNVIRVGPVTDKIGTALLEVVRKFDWHHVVLLTSSASAVCEYGSSSFNTNIRGTNITIAEWIRFPYSDDDPTPDALLDFYLRSIQERGRIVLICAYRNELIRFMLRAQELGMTNGEYVFLYYFNVPSYDFYFYPWDYNLPENITDEDYKKRRTAFHVFKEIGMGHLSGPAIDEFRRQVRIRAAGPPNYFVDYEPGEMASLYGPFIYDAMTLYLLLVNESLALNLDYRNSSVLLDMARNRKFHGKTGEVILGDQADREPIYWLWHGGPEVDVMTPAIEISTAAPPGERVTYIDGVDIYWGTPDNAVPRAVPLCGFTGELCPPDTGGRNQIIGIVVGLLALLVLLIIAYLIYQRKQMHEKELNAMLWRIDYNEINQTQKRTGSMIGLSMKSLQSSTSHGSRDEARLSNAHQHEQMFTLVGMYRGNTVAIRMVNKEKIILNREQLQILNVLREMKHDNLNEFVGASIDPPNVCIVTTYCQKGSLQDILENDDIKLDWMFRCSLISDLNNGLAFLHSSPVKVHGSLKSSNCLVNTRWMLKISGAALSFFKHGERVREEVGDYERYRKMLWTAPELLRKWDMLGRPEGTQKGDVYSLALIMQEIIFRSSPFFLETITPKEVIDMVIKFPYRPEVPKPDDEVDQRMVKLMTECWDEDPHNRPSTDSIKRRLVTINQGRKFNIVDHMVQKLEKYASNLEEIVAQRTSELVEEKKKTDVLLHKMLPEVVADDLKRGKIVEAEVFEQVTIYFSDIYGFQALSSASSPMQMVDLLNDLYTLMDSIIEQHDVYKVETIGDAYMCVSGLPRPNGDHHSAAIADMSLDLLSAVTSSFKIRHMPGERAQLRIGVVGLSMPRYCLFGDTVNMASRMESNGQPLRIHMSRTCYEALSKFSVYKMLSRGEMQIKGKGLQKTYFLVNKDGFDKPLPVDDE